MPRRLASAFWFTLPLLVLVAIWALVVRVFEVHARIFPDVASVGRAAVQSIQDGTLLKHVAASMDRVLAGTALALVVAIPMGVAMGVSAGVSTFFTPMLRFFCQRFDLTTVLPWP